VELLAPVVAVAALSDKVLRAVSGIRAGVGLWQGRNCWSLVGVILSLSMFARWDTNLFVSDQCLVLSEREPKRGSPEVDVQGRAGIRRRRVDYISLVSVGRFVPRLGVGCIDWQALLLDVLGLVCPVALLLILLLWMTFLRCVGLLLPSVLVVLFIF
jgi:hypothetical protein